MIELIKESGLALALTVLPITILANILIGAAMAGIDIRDHFDKKKLLKGLVKGLLVYLAILIYALASFLMKDLSVDFMGQSYDLVDAMYIVILATIVKYAKDGLDKLIKIMKYKEDNQEEVEVEEEEENIIHGFK